MVQQIKVRFFNATRGDIDQIATEEQKCPICHESFQAGDVLASTDCCKHNTTCSTCFVTWAYAQTGQTESGLPKLPRCPKCRARFDASALRDHLSDVVASIVESRYVLGEKKSLTIDITVGGGLLNDWFVSDSDDMQALFGVFGRLARSGIGIDDLFDSASTRTD